MKKIRILINEENRLLRDGISAMLNEQSDMHVAGAVASVEKVLAVMEKYQLDIVLLNLSALAQEGVRIVIEIRKFYPEAKVILMDVLTHHTDVFEYVQSGVSGFILKDANSDELVKTIRSVYQGTYILPAHLIGSLFSQIARGNMKSSKSFMVAESIRMTQRERQVIELITDGSTNKDIAQKLHLSIYTVKSHVHNILQKLALKTRLQIAKHAQFTDPFNS